MILYLGPIIAAAGGGPMFANAIDILMTTQRYPKLQSVEKATISTLPPTIISKK